VTRPAIAIRPLGPPDAERYRALRLRGLAEHPEAFTSSAEEEAAAPVAALASRLAPGPGNEHDVVLGAFVAGELAGLVGMSVDPRAKVRHRGHVFGMYVPVERSRQGIGAALLGAIIARAEGIAQLDRLELTVTAGNAGACGVYERAGFVAWGREPGAVRVAGVLHDKLHMTRLLAAPAAAA
jgi:RimJ/RimL family protein N-acetyltransferase